MIFLNLTSCPTLFPAMLYHPAVPVRQDILESIEGEDTGQFSVVNNIFCFPSNREGNPQLPMDFLRSMSTILLQWLKERK